MTGVLRSIVLLAGLLAGSGASLVEAQPQIWEFTPGPRMIRLLERIAQEHEARAQALGLTEQQRQALAGLLRECK
ncbi:hypothetical protein [Nitrospira sp. Kam-Ns4a]